MQIICDTCDDAGGLSLDPAVQPGKMNIMLWLKWQILPADIADRTIQKNQLVLIDTHAGFLNGRPGQVTAKLRQSIQDGGDYMVYG